MRRRIIPLAAAAAVGLGLALMASPAATLPPVAPDDVPVTNDRAYTRHDGGTDRAIAHCGNPASNPAPTAAAGGDADPTDGGNRRQGNEPALALIPPTPI